MGSVIVLGSRKIVLGYVGMRGSCSVGYCGLLKKPFSSEKGFFACVFKSPELDVEKWPFLF